MPKFTIEAGIVFKPNDASRASIKKTLNQATADFELKIAKARITSDAQNDLVTKLSKKLFKIGKAKFLPAAFNRLTSQFTKRSFKIGKAGFTGAAKKSLQTEFSAIPFTIQNLKLGAGAISKLQQSVGKVPIRGAGAARARDPVTDIATQAKRLKQIRQEFASAIAGSTPQSQLEGLTKAQQKATIQANTLARNLREIGPAASVGVARSVKELTTLRRIFSDLGISTKTAARAQAFLGIKTAGLLNTQGNLIRSTSTLQNQIAQLTRVQSNFGRVQDKNTSRIGNQVIALTKLNQSLRSVGATQSTVISSVTNQTNRLTAVQKTFAGGQAQVTKGVGTTADRLVRVRGEVEKVARSIGVASKANSGVASSFQGAGSSAQLFGSRLVEVTGRFAAYAVALRIVLGVQQAFAASLRTIVEFDSVLQDLQKVLNETPAGLQRLSDGIFEAARNTGRGIDEVAASLNTFVRQGLNVEDALARTQSALIATNISELDVAESTKLLTSALKIFGDELQNDIEVLDILSITADNAATNAAEVGRAFIRSASAAKLTGVSFRDLTAFITATIDRTQEAGSRVGTALKTIFTRLQTNSKILRDNANALGANILANDDLSTVIEKLSILFQRLEPEQKTQIATLVAGRRQVNIFAGLIDSFGKSQELLAKQSDAAGTALDKQSRELQKLSTQVDILKVGFQELIVELSGVDEGAEGVTGIRAALSDIVGFTTSAVSGVTDFIKAIKSIEIVGLRLSTIFSGIAKTALFVGGASLVRLVVKGIFAAVGATRQLGSQLSVTAKILQLNAREAGIVKTNEEQTLAVEKQRETVLRRIFNLTRSIAGTRGRGVGGRGGGGEGATRGATALAVTGAIVGLQLAETALRDLSTALRDTGDAADNLTVGIADASSSALSFGATVGLLSGSLRAGVLTALTAFALSFAKFARETEANANTIRGLIIEEARARISGTEALKTGNRALIAVFQEEADRTGNAFDGILIQQTLALTRAFGAVGGALERGARTIESIGNELGEIERAIARAGQVARTERAQRAAVAPFRGREISARLGAEGGALGQDFSEIDRIIASTQLAAEAIVGPIKDSAAAADVFGRAMEFVLSKTKDASLQQGQLLEQLRLQSPEFSKLSASLDEQAASARDQRDAAAAARQELEGLIAKDFPIRLNREEFDRLDAALKKADADFRRRVAAAEAERNRGSLFQARLASLLDKRQRAEQRLAALQKAKNSLSAEEQKTIEQISEELKEVGGQTENLSSASKAVLDTNKNLLPLIQARIDGKKEIVSLLQSEKAATAELVNIDKARNKGIETNAKAVEKIVANRRKLIALVKAQTAEVAARSQVLRDEVSDLESQLGFETQLQAARRDGLSSSEELFELSTRASRQIEEQVRIQERLNQRTLERLQAQRDAANISIESTKIEADLLGDRIRLSQVELDLKKNLTDEDRESRRVEIERLKAQRERIASIGAGSAKEATDLESVIKKLEESLKAQAPLIRAEVKTRVEIEFRRDLQGLIETQEKALADFRVTEIRRVVSEQEKATERQIASLQEFGDTDLGDRVFGGLLRSIGDPVANVFGRTNAAVLKLQEQQLDRFASSVAEEFNVLTREIAIDLDKIDTAALAGNLEDFSKSGVSSIERLQLAQRLQNELLERSRAQVENRRQVALERAQASAKRVEEAEKDLIKARNEIPAANQRLIEVQKELASANKAVKDASQELLSAFGQASDAQAEFRFQVQLAGFQARQELGSFSSVGQQFAELGNIFRTTTEEITASERTRLQLARQIAQAQLSLLQEQFQAVQSLGVQAATATGQQLFELQQAIGTAAGVQTGQVDIDTLGPELLQAISSLPDTLFPGLQRTIAELGLERLGIDPETFQSLEDEILELTRTTAETNQEGIIAANEQIRLAQQQIVEAQNNRNTAENQLLVAQEQKAALLQNVSVARLNLSNTRAGFTTQIRRTAQVIARLDGQISATRRVDQTLKEIAQILRNQTTAIEAARFSGQATLGGQGLEQQLQTAGNFLNDLKNTILGNLGINTAAGGNVTASELAGLTAAASREKRAMPPGSNLMLANTSEVVLTRKQARMVGLRPVAKANAQDGNATGDTAALGTLVNTLNQTMNALLTRLNSPGFIEQNISVSVDSQRTLNIRGVEAFDSTVRTVLEERFGVMAQQEEVDGVVAALGALVLSLNEQGIVNAQGR